MRKASKRSAGLLMYRKQKNEVEVFLVHAGGPFWAGQDLGSWTIPKGEYDTEEQPLAAAQREFHEETGFTATGIFTKLGTIQQKSGKVVDAWAFEGDCNASQLRSNACEIEWPPRTGNRVEIPEIDRGSWFAMQMAMKYLRPEQIPLLEALKSFIISDHSSLISERDA